MGIRLKWSIIIPLFLYFMSFFLKKTHNNKEKQFFVERRMQGTKNCYFNNPFIIKKFSLLNLYDYLR